MNRLVLLLNLVVLVVNFLLVLTATDSQIGIMQSTSGIAYGSRVSRRAGGEDWAPRATYLRVVQSLESIAPGAAAELTPDEYATIYAAVKTYYSATQRGLDSALAETGNPATLRRAYGEIGRVAREDVSRALERSFSDNRFVQRLTTEILKNGR